MIEKVVKLFALSMFLRRSYALWNQYLLSTGLKKGHRPNRLLASEIMAIFIGSALRNGK